MKTIFTWIDDCCRIHSLSGCHQNASSKHMTILKAICCRSLFLQGVVQCTNIIELNHRSSSPVFMNEGWIPALTPIPGRQPTVGMCRDRPTIRWPVQRSVPRFIFEIYLTTATHSLLGLQRLQIYTSRLSVPYLIARFSEYCSRSLFAQGERSCAADDVGFKHVRFPAR